MPGHQEHLQAHIYRLNIQLEEHLRARDVDHRAVWTILVSYIDSTLDKP